MATRCTAADGLPTAIRCSPVVSVLLVLCLILPLASAARAGSLPQSVPISLRLAPEAIEMGAFYNGARLRIEGTAPARSQIVVVIRGEEKDEFFNRKGRVGPIWVNVDRIHVTRAPSLFLFFSSADLNSLLDPGSIEAHQLDVAAIRNRLACRCHCKCSVTQSHAPGSKQHCQGVEPDAQYRELIRLNYVGVKSSEGNYQTHANDVQLADQANGTGYVVNLDWPRKASAGSYSVEVYACRNHAVIAQATAVLRVVEVGFPAQMAGLAATRPWTYGTLAVVVAVIAGFTIDALTSRLRRYSVVRRNRPGSPSSEPLATSIPAVEETREHEHVHHL